jgi:hypothetical protein
MTARPGLLPIGPAVTVVSPSREPAALRSKTSRKRETRWRPAIARRSFGISSATAKPPGGSVPSSQDNPDLCTARDLAEGRRHLAPALCHVLITVRA